MFAKDAAAKFYLEAGARDIYTQTHTDTRNHLCIYLARHFFIIYMNSGKRSEILRLAGGTLIFFSLVFVCVAFTIYIFFL